MCRGGSIFGHIHPELRREVAYAPKSVVADGNEDDVGVFFAEILDRLLEEFHVNRHTLVHFEPPLHVVSPPHMHTDERDITVAVDVGLSEDALRVIHYMIFKLELSLYLLLCRLEECIRTRVYVPLQKVGISRNSSIFRSQVRGKLPRIEFLVHPFIYGQNLAWSNKDIFQVFHIARQGHKTLAPIQSSYAHQSGVGAHLISQASCVAVKRQREFMEITGGHEEDNVDHICVTVGQGQNTQNKTARQERDLKPPEDPH